MTSIGECNTPGGTGMFKEGDIRAYDPAGDAERAKQTPSGWGRYWR